MARTVAQFLLTYCIILLISRSATAQSTYQVNHYTTENGLPSNGIKGLQWDATTGFLWIATEAGIVRYNGMDFATFDNTTNPEIGSNRVVCLLKNAAGKIIAGGESGNLSVVTENNISLWFRDSGKAKNNYNYHGATEASDTLFRRCNKNPFPNQFSFYNGALATVNDTLCVILAQGALYYYTVSTEQPVLIRSAPADIRKIFKIGNQLYCFNTANELFACDVLNNNYTKRAYTNEAGKAFFLDATDSYIFWQTGMDQPVVLQQGKAWLLEMKDNQQIQCRLIASGIPENTLFYFAQYNKKSDYLYLGSDSKGIFIIHKNQLRSIQPPSVNIHQRNSFYSQIELPDGNILTNEGEIIGDNPASNDYNIGKGFINSVYTINDSLMIYAYRDSLYRYNKKTYSRKLMFSTHINQGFSLAFSGNHLYFGNQNGIGIIKENGTIEFLKNFDQKTATVFRIFDMTEIAPGRLGLATCDGLLQFDTNTKETDTLLKLPSICIRSLHKEGDYIFIGTYGGGFYIMKHGILKAMPPDKNQYLKYAHCFIKDDAGFYWISTNNGLFKVKLADIIDAYEKDLPQVYYHYLGKNDGMQTTEMNGGCIPCAIRLKNNTFSFPTMDGLLWFNPEQTNITLPSGKIFIDRVLVDGMPQQVTGNVNLQLPENVNRLDISLVVNAWCRKENLYIDYQLNGAKWLPAEMSSGEPRISFENLSYGSYAVTIRKMNGFGAGNYTYSTFAFTIAAPFYHQWWFRILAIVFLAGVGYLLFRLRMRQYALREKKLTAMVEEKTKDLNLKNRELERNNTIKLRLISIINHDIMTPLKFMHYAGKALVENKGAIKTEEQLETISEITQTAKDMEQLSSQILNWIIYQNPDRRMEKEDFNLHQLVELVFRVLQFSAKEKHTMLQNNVPVNFVVHQYLDPMRVMIYNLVMNSLNFTRHGIINVSCTETGPLLMLQVADSGLGMTQEQVDNLLSEEKIIAAVNLDNKKGSGLGYLIIKDLLRMMGGLLDIKSEKGKGTTVMVSIPFQ